ncbi:MAG: glycosyltransferase [Lachnospiraceae bacterium]|nr:glycosyltransferase [Lachnospiraceae bacterium]
MIDKKAVKLAKDKWENPYKYWIKENENFSGLLNENTAMKDLEKDYVFCVLKDGERAEHFAGRILNVIGEERPGIIYFDEDVYDRGAGRKDPFFKPDYSPDTLKSFYYPGALTLVDKEIELFVRKNYAYSPSSPEYLKECFREAVKREKEIVHIPEVLFSAYDGRDIEYSVRDNDTHKDESCKVSAIILSKDHPGLLKRCISGLKKLAEKEETDLEIIVVDNGSDPGNKKEYSEQAGEYGFKYIYREMPFLYSVMNNIGAKEAAGDILLFLNDDIEIPGKVSFLKRMAHKALKDDVGAVGIKLLYPGEELIQHAGISLLKSGPSHKLNGYPDSEVYYHGVNRRDINVLAVTGAALMVEKKKFISIGGFDEELAVSYTDTDLCLDLVEKGFRSVCLNSRHLIHHESISRGNDLKDRVAYERLIKEKEYFYGKHEEFLKKGDPYYSDNLTETGLDYDINYIRPGEDIPLTDKLSRCDHKSNLKELSDKELNFSAESTEYVISDANGQENYYLIRGWSFLNVLFADKYRRELIIEDGDNAFRVSVSDIYRKDVTEVFSKKKGIDFCGYEAHIDARLFDEAKEYMISLAFVSGSGEGKIKGFIKENVCRIKTTKE